MVRRFIGLGVATLAVSAGTLGLTTTPAQAAGKTTGHVVSTIDLRTRSGSTTAAKVVATSKPGSDLTLRCKARGSTVDGNNLWYRLSGKRRWVSARYVANVGSSPRWCGHDGHDVSKQRAQHPAGQADDTVRAWGRGDRHRVQQLAQPGVVDTLFNHANPGGRHWRRVRTPGGSGAMGTFYYTYRNDATGAKLVLGVTDEGISEAVSPAVRKARFS